MTTPDTRASAGRPGVKRLHRDTARRFWAGSVRSAWGRLPAAKIGANSYFAARRSCSSPALEEVIQEAQGQWTLANDHARPRPLKDVHTSHRGRVFRFRCDLVVLGLRCSQRFARARIRLRSDRE